MNSPKIVKSRSFWDVMNLRRNVVKSYGIVLSLFVLSETMLMPAIGRGQAMPPMLNLPVTAGDPGLIDYFSLPVLAGEHAIVSRGEAPWAFRLHSYLAFFDGQYWCMWSHGPVIEDKPTQHVRYAT